MKLKSLKIEGYKNLTINSTFDNNDGYIALIGLNGSGKSNMLEAISIIFNNLSGINNNSEVDSYHIEYEISGKQVIAETNDVLSPDKLPSNIISCYSGEDSRLWEKCYRDYYVKFFNDAVKKGGEYRPKSLYINKYCWKIAFIALLYSEEFSIQSFLEEKLHINLKSIEIKFVEKTDSNIIDHDASKWYQRVKASIGNGYFGIDKLKSIELQNTKYSDELSDDAIVFYYLYLLSMPVKNSKIGLTVDKIIDNIEINVNGYPFEGLSEGEKKLILIECITKVLGDNNSLVLLDEPDAHTHIALKKVLLSVIRESKGQIVLTTHSPIFADLMSYNNLVYLTDGRIENMEKIQAIKIMSDYQLNILDCALISSSKKLLITEGPGDVIHLEKVIESLSLKYARFKPLENDVAIVFQGGAKMVDDYYHSVLSGIYDNIDKAIFVFDHDEEGRVGEKLVKTIAKDKIDYLFYEKKYPINSTENNFYLEDFYPNSIYSEVNLPTISGKPHYCQMKKMDSLAKSVKEKISKKIKNGNVDVQNFEGFTNFLDQLLIKFGYNV